MLVLYTAMKHETVDLKAAIANAIEIMHANPSASPSEIVALFKYKTNNADLSEELYEFVPLSFTKVMCVKWGIEFPETFYRAKQGGGISHACPLSAEPLWVECTKYVKDFFTRIPEGFELGNIARHCALFCAVVKSMTQGDAPSGGVLSPPLFLRPAPMPCKPWWRFW